MKAAGCKDIGLVKRLLENQSDESFSVYMLDPSIEWTYLLILSLPD